MKINWKKLASLTAPFILFGCHTFQQLETGLGNLDDIDRATSVLGYPDHQMQVGNDLVYVWARNQSGSYTLPQQQTQYGNVYGNVGTTPYYGNYSTTQTVYQTYNYNYYCEIKLAFNPENQRIINWSYDGNIGGCGPYIQRLKDAGLTNN